MKARVKWVGDRSFTGQVETGHTIAFGNGVDGKPKPGPSPMELILIGTGGCSAYDVVHILEKGREPVEDVVCDVTAERAETDPKVFTKIHLHFTVTGRGLNPAKVERAVGLSIEKYCSASAMMAKTAEVTHGFEVIDPGA
ncbi:putative redox protein [Defluviimonas denitrificans]|jgi:putative redox protein|uniref:Putative redox protein n=1 Tax=Albidovulum denitrificans TaxID=404881 RepID=A0A2S8SAJ2_9RHOB|nr:OsmC family protein [Defluviimonas denitrificans]PQV57769.1 putative redox protein [Defluviimonas denitrificans]